MTSTRRSSRSSRLTANVYGAPWQNITAGGVFYNKPLYTSLGLKIPTTWDEFMANNAAIKKAGKAAPVEQTFGDTWTSQIMVLADYHNVQAANPTFAEDYTSNKAKFATTPEALAGFEKLQALFDAKYLNEDFASAKFNDGLAAVAKGTAAHYPMITFGDPRDRGRGSREPQGRGLLRASGRRRRQERRHLVVDRRASTSPRPPRAPSSRRPRSSRRSSPLPPAVTAQAGGGVVGGPFAVKTCELPSDVPDAVNELVTYIEAGKVTPALEFLSPIKGPALEQILVEVGSGIRDAKSGAGLYDQDVEKQAKQLGLEGW